VGFGEGQDAVNGFSLGKALVEPGMFQFVTVNDNLQVANTVAQHGYVSRAGTVADDHFAELRNA
jgi:hypothetical protein